MEPMAPTPNPVNVANDPIVKAADMVRANSSLLAAPKAVLPLASTPDISGTTLGHATTALSVLGQLKPTTHVVNTNSSVLIVHPDGTTSSPVTNTKQQINAVTPPTTTTTQPAPKVVNGVVMVPQKQQGGWLHGFEHDFDVVRHGVAGAADGLVTGASDLAWSLTDAIKRLGITAAELGTLGLVGAKGFGFSHMLANEEDADASIANTALTPVNLVNPWSDKNIIYSLGHLGAAFMTNVKLKGWGYAIGNVIPLAVAALATEGALAGVGLVGESAVAADLSTVETLTARAASGETLTTADLTRLAKATERVSQRAAMDSREATVEDGLSKLQSWANDRRASMRDAITNAGIGDLGVGTPLKILLKVADKISAPGRSVTANLMDALANYSQQRDPYSKLVWELTANGDVWDHNGNHTSFGKGIDDLMGIDPNGLWGSVVAGSGDFYTKWLAADPFGAAGKITAQARTAEGLGGILGKWFDGTRITSFADLLDKLSKYPKMRRTVTFLANHSSSEIAGRFGDTFSKAQRDMLGAAKSEDEIVNLLGQWADAHQLAKETVPTMTVGNLVGAKVKDGLSLLRGPEGFIAQGVKAIRENIGMFRRAGIDPLPKTGSEVLDPNIDQIVETIRLRWLRRSFNKEPLWTDPITYKQETKEINLLRPESAIKGILQRLQNFGVSRAFRSQIGNELYDAVNNPNEFKIVAKNAYSLIPHSILQSGLDNHALSTFREPVKKFMNDQLEKMVASDQGSATAAIVAGRNSRVYESVLNKTGMARHDAIGFTEVGGITLPNEYNLRMLGTEIENIIKNQIPTSLIRENDMILMGKEELSKLAEFSNASLEGVTDAVKNSKTLENIKVSDSPEFRDGYSSARLEVLNLIEEALRNSKEFTPGKFDIYNKDSIALVDAFDSLRNKYMSLKNISVVHNAFKLGEISGEISDPAFIQQLEAKILPNEFVRTLSDLKDNLPIRLKGMMMAYQDGIHEIALKLDTQVFSHAELERQATEFWKNRNVDGGIVSESLSQEWAKQIENLQKRNGNFSSVHHDIADSLSVFLNQTWNRLCLFTGNWAFHIFGGEAMLSAARYGVKNWVDASIINSYVKHSLGYGRLGDDVEKRMIVKMRQRIEQMRLLKTDKSEITVFNENEFQKSNLNAMGKAVGAALYGIDNILKGSRDIFGGTILGFQNSLLEKMYQEENYRNLIDDTVYMMEKTDAHLPSAIEGTHGGITEGDVIDYHKSRITLGFGKDGFPVLGHGYPAHYFEPHSMTTHADNFGGAVHQSLLRVGKDYLKKSTVADFAELVLAKGKEILKSEGKSVSGLTDKEIMAKAANAFKFDDLAKSSSPLVRSAYDRELPEEQKLIFGRQQDRLPDGAQNKEPGMNNAKGDHAIALVNDVLGHFTGSELSDVIHTNWLHDVWKEQVPIAQQVLKDLAAMPEKDRPVNIPNRVMVPYRDLQGVLKGGSSLGFVGRIADYGFEHVLGRLVNTLNREPAMILSNHFAMNQYRDLVARGIIPEDMARARSMEEAAVSMKKFIHNPLDKTQWEKNARLTMPFWFAKNQALRRVFRLFSDNPGAGYRYVKAMIGLSQTIYTEKNSITGKLSAWIPASQYLVSPMIDLIGLPANLFQIGADITLGSIATMDPIGNTPTIGGVVGTVARPEFGPLVELPLEALSGIFGLLHMGWGKNLVKTVDPNTQYGILSTLQPNPAINALLTGTVYSIAGGSGLEPLQNSMVASFTNSALKTILENELEKNVVYVEKNFAADIAAQDASNREGWISAKANAMMAAEWSQTSYSQKQIDNAIAIGGSMAVAQALVDVLFPGKATVTSVLDKSADYKKFASTYSDKVMPDGTPQYSKIEVLNMYLHKNPAFFVWTLPSTQQLGSLYPDSKQFVDWATKYPDVFNTWKNGPSLLFNPTGKFDLASISLQTTFGLREANTPQEVVDAYLVQSGKLYVNDVINAKYPNWKFGTPGYSAREAKERKDEISSYLSSNRVYSNYQSYTNDDFYTGQSIKELGEMINSPSVPNEMFGGKAARAEWVNMLQMYNDEAAKINSSVAPTRVTTGQRYNWADKCAKIAESGVDPTSGVKLTPAQINFWKVTAPYLPTIPVPK